VSEGPVDAVFFDLYGTLVDLAALDAACEAAVPGFGADLAVRWRQRQIEATWLRTAMDRWADFETVTEGALAVAAAELGVAPDASALGATLLPAWRRLPARAGVGAVLDRLDAAQLPAGIVTNGSASMLAASVDGAGLAGRFRWRLSADAVRRYKPAPAVYALATEAAGAPADRIGFVTANAWDAAGAAAFGFRVAWLRTPGVELPAVGPIDRPPVAVRIGSLADWFGA
jgi:2-haloacid dehalogenase